MCPVCVVCVAGSLSSGSCGVTTGVSPGTRVARSSWIDRVDRSL